MINVDKTKVTATCINRCDILVNNEKLQQLSNIPDNWWCRMHKRYPCKTWKQHRDFKIYAETMAKLWQLNRH